MFFSKHDTLIGYNILYNIGLAIGGNRILADF